MRCTRFSPTPNFSFRVDDANVEKTMQQNTANKSKHRTSSATSNKVSTFYATAAAEAMTIKADGDDDKNKIRQIKKQAFFSSLSSRHVVNHNIASSLDDTSSNSNSESCSSSSSSSRMDGEEDDSSFSSSESSSSNDERQPVGTPRFSESSMLDAGFQWK